MPCSGHSETEPWALWIFAESPVMWQKDKEELSVSELAITQAAIAFIFCWYNGLHLPLNQIPTKTIIIKLKRQIFFTIRWEWVWSQILLKSCLQGSLAFSIPLVDNTFPLQITCKYLAFNCRERQKVSKILAIRPRKAAGSGAKACSSYKGPNTSKQK